MIEIVGHKVGAELDAANELCQAISFEWPDVAEDRNRLDEVRIIVGGQVFGGNVQDLDLTVLVSLRKPRTIDALTRRTMDDEPVEFRVQHACIAIELKDVTARNLRFVGGMAEVRYGQEWKNASHQNREQVITLKNLLRNMGARPPFIHGLLWLRNAPAESIPPFLTNILVGHMPSWNEVLDLCDSISPNRFASALNAEADRGIRQVFDIVGRQREPTRLDRVRMNTVVRDSLQPELRQAVGRVPVILRGRGGTGKTAALLQLAYSAYVNERRRVLFLTYNRALVADVRRQLDLLGAPAAVHGEGILVSTVHAFFIRWLTDRTLGLEPGFSEATFSEEKYDNAITEMLECVRDGLISADDIQDAKKSDEADLRWDLICVDEGQDWPEAERDLLRRLYEPSGCVVADGIDQLIRREVPCRWDADTGAKALIEFLPQCRRMQTGLVQFANSLARNLELHDWRLEPFNALPGGRVVILEEDYFSDAEFHRELRKDNARAGNKGIDMLYCVPPSYVAYSGDEASSYPARKFREWNELVWDGVDVSTRIQFPTNVEQLRIVQYDSSRGLEGWTVVNLGLDGFYDYKYDKFEVPSHNNGIAFDEAIERHRFAARWLMIPMTRAMDTIVITLGSRDSVLKNALKRSHDELRDIVEWPALARP